MKKPLTEIVSMKLSELNESLKPENGYYDDDREEYVEEHSFLRDSRLSETSIAALFPNDQKGELEVDRFAPKVEKEILKQIKTFLQNDPKRNQDFNEKTDWKVLNQLLAVFRLKELSEVKIIKRGGRGKGLSYDASELARTFFGKKILTGQGLVRRRILKADELEKVKEDCARLKLELPEIVEPTTTEKFFQS